MKKVYFGKKLIAGALLDLSEGLIESDSHPLTDERGADYALAHVKLLLELAKRELQ